jgi:3-oxoacyl-[acyl-carrier protein] reductase
VQPKSFLIPDIENKVCLVTGSSRGIGAAVARRLGAMKAKVAVHYNSGKSEAGAVAEEIARSGTPPLILAGDLAEPNMIENLIDRTVQHFGRLDILINNAGDVIRRYPVAETPDELFDQHVAVNIRPVFAGCRRAVRQFREQGNGGVIVNVSSVAARTGGGGGSSLYAGAKAFVATFTRALAKEVAKDRIRVNAVSPGVIQTPMQDRTTPSEQLKAAIAAIPMGRVGEAEECVGAFLYLCSDQLSGYVTGQIIEVNGGIVMP